jgi:hypothetical protein
MYHLIRKIHLFTGLLLLVFVIMYFASGYVMIHPRWFGERQPKLSVRTEALNFPAEPSDGAFAERLKEAFGLRGQSSPPERRKDGSTRFNFVRPGTAFQADLSPDGKQITITRKDFGFSGLANGMHRLRGYHGGWLYYLWAFLYDLASGALIIFAITGIILWYQSCSRRLAGWACLAASFGFTAGMICYLMWAS